MSNNVTFEHVEKQIFSGTYPIVPTTLSVKSTITEGDIIGVSTAGEYGKFDEATYTIPYAIAYGSATYVDTAIPCNCILTGEVVESFVKLPTDTAKKLSLVQELRKIGLFIR